MPHPLPQTPEQWLNEINLAYKDAKKTKLFALLTGTWLTNADLFHVAPLVCMKFRGMNMKDEGLRKRVVEGTLATYVANTGPDAPDRGLDTNVKLAFALCYMSAHYVLDLVDEDQAQNILSYCEEHLSGS